MNKNYLKIMRVARKVIYCSLAKIDYLLNRSNNIVILCYHSISDSDWEFGVRKDTFAAHMNLLSENRTPITLEEVYHFISDKRALPKKYFVITFDDAYKSILKVKDIIKKHNIKPTVFALSESNLADRGQLSTKESMLSTDELLQLQSDGWEIGSHSATHCDFYKLDTQKRKQQIRDSKRKLSAVGLNIRYFAYPRGRYTTSIINSVRSAKYKLAVTMDDDIITHNTTRFKVPRVGVVRSHTLSEFICNFSPSVILFRRVVKKLGLPI